MGLVQAGARSVEVIEVELAANGATRMMVRVLADIGGDDARRLLTSIAGGSGEAAALARDVLTRSD